MGWPKPETYIQILIRGWGGQEQFNATYRKQKKYILTVFERDHLNIKRWTVVLSQTYSQRKSIMSNILTKIYNFRKSLNIKYERSLYVRGLFGLTVSILL